MQIEPAAGARLDECKARARVVAIGLALPPAKGRAAEGRPNQIEIVYGEPTQVEHADLCRLLHDQRALENVQAFLSPIRLPRKLRLTVETCGEANAWYEDPTVTVCYEYLDYVSKAARSPERPHWLRVEEALIGAFVDVFLHEVGHALIDYLKLPILGNEEVAAGQISAFMILTNLRSRAGEEPHQGNGLHLRV
jgi:hypothetical protein